MEFGNFSNLKVQVKGKDQKSIEEAVKVLRKYKIEISEDPDLILSIGGDGTCLKSYDKSKGTPILPIRTEGNLGYIPDIGIKELDEACEKLVKRLYYVERRIMLDACEYKKRKIGSAINEITLSATSTRAMRFKLSTNGKDLFAMKKIMGDGVIISTPTGSTGYNRAAGGRIPPLPNQIVVTLLNPTYMPPSEEKSKILDDSTVIKLSFTEPEEAFLIIDNEGYKLEKNSYIVIKKSLQTFNLVKIKGMEESFEEKERRREEWFKKFTNGY